MTRRRIANFALYGHLQRLSALARKCCRAGNSGPRSCKSAFENPPSTFKHEDASSSGTLHCLSSSSNVVCFLLSFTHPLAAVTGFFRCAGTSARFFMQLQSLLLLTQPPTCFTSSAKRTEFRSMALSSAPNYYSCRIHDVLLLSTEQTHEAVASRAR